jgi:hypothetical protein
MAGASLLALPLSWHNYLMLLMPGVLVLVVRGRWPIAVLLLALSFIGMEWQWVWGAPEMAASRSRRARAAVSDERGTKPRPPRRAR